MVQKDGIQIHFFEFKELDPKENYGQVYIRTDDINEFFFLLKCRMLTVLNWFVNPGNKENFLFMILITIC
jgi:hypothetical protein